jgi:hypothetical protein
VLAPPNPSREPLSSQIPFPTPKVSLSRFCKIYFTLVLRQAPAVTVVDVPSFSVTVKLAVLLLPEIAVTTAGIQNTPLPTAPTMSPVGWLVAATEDGSGARTLIDAQEMLSLKDETKVTVAVAPVPDTEPLPMIVTESPTEITFPSAENAAILLPLICYYFVFGIFLAVLQDNLA